MARLLGGLRRAFWRLLLFLSVSFFLLILFLAGFVCYFSSDLPRLEELFLSFRRPCLHIYDNRGRELATYGDVYGHRVAAADLPPYVIKALMAVEDKRFYSHFGIDFLGNVRALWTNYKKGRVVQGASTITQQLGKNILQAHRLYPVTDRSIKRKIQEAILAFLLEAKLTKNQILTLYLNRVYFGAGTFGIDAASRRYFGRPAKQLTLYEAAMLMGLLKAPSRYSPAQNPEKSEVRTRQVLRRMVAAGFITQRAMNAAFLMATPPPEVVNNSSVHYFTDWVVDQLRHIVSLNQDLKVYTTIDLDLQKIAEEKIKDVAAQYAAQWHKKSQMAMISMTPDGAVKAMVGGVSYGASKFNRVTQALRQPGSAFKFFIYLQALKDGLMPEHKISDQPIEIGTWKPKNYLYEARGEVTLRTGFAKSINAVAIRLGLLVGIDRIIELARTLGITTPLNPNLSLALGSGETTLLEMTGAFSTIANDGIKVKPYGIIKITTKKNKLLYRHIPTRQLVLHPKVVDRMRSLMINVVTNGTGRRIQMNRPTACKTGTSQKYRDLWMIGFSPELVTGVWTGCDNDQPMQHARSGSPSSHLWRMFMEEALKKTPVQQFRSVSLPDHTGMSSPDDMLGDDWIFWKELSNFSAIDDENRENFENVEAAKKNTEVTDSEKKKDEAGDESSEQNTEDSGADRKAGDFDASKKVIAEGYLRTPIDTLLLRSSGSILKEKH